MKITELSPQKRNSSRFNLSVDGAFFCGISATGVAQYTLYEGKEIDEETLDEIVKEELYRRFLDRCADYLSKVSKSERGLRTYLKQLHYKKKGSWFNEDFFIDWDAMFDRVVEQLKKYKYLDDKRYSQQFIESRAKNRPRSASLITSELISKGISREDAKNAVSEFSVSNETMIDSVYKKKFKDAPLDLKERKKVDFLRRKGFNWDDISKLADRLKDDTAE